MSDGRGKSQMELWEDARSLLIEEELKYDIIANKESKSAQNKMLKIEGLRLKIAELNEKKDEIELTEGAKRYLARLYGYIKYQKWVVPVSDRKERYFKGLFLEKEAISLISELDGEKYIKNTFRIADDFLSGVPDVVEDHKIIDIKCSWDIVTFFANLYKSLSPQYWWQMQGYLSITGMGSGEISFCLLSTPPACVDQIISDMKMRGTLFIPEDEAREKFNYDSIPKEERRIKFIIERDDEAIAQIPKRVQKAREFLAFLEESRIKPRLGTNDLSGQTDTAFPDLALE